MGVSWAFVVLLVYPALQLPLLWVLVRYFGLRNDDGPADPRGYTFHESAENVVAGTGPDPGSCRHCGEVNAPQFDFCRECLARLG